MAHCSHGILERLGQLGQVVLVAERKLDASGHDARMAAGEPLDGAPHAVGERGIDRCRARSRPLPRAGPLRPLLGSADGQAAPAAPAEKTVNTSFWIPVELRQELRVCAAENGTTFSALLVEGGRHVLRKYSNQK